MHVLGPNAEPEQAGRDAPQDRKEIEKPEDERRLRPPLACQNAADDPLLDGELEPLREAHGQGAPLSRPPTGHVGWPVLDL